MLLVKMSRVASDTWSSSYFNPLLRNTLTWCLKVTVMTFACSHFVAGALPGRRTHPLQQHHCSKRQLFVIWGRKNKTNSPWCTITTVRFKAAGIFPSKWKMHFYQEAAFKQINPRLEGGFKQALSLLIINTEDITVSPTTAEGHWGKVIKLNSFIQC